MIDSKDLFNLNVKQAIDDDAIIDLFFKDDYIKSIILKNDMTREEIFRNANKFLEYLKDTYVNDEGKKESKTMHGFVLSLSLVDDCIKTSYVRIAPEPKKSKMKLLNIPPELAQASFEDFELSNDLRKKAYNYAKRFVNLFDSDNMIKGMYLCGDFRLGKTYLASAIGNYLADRGYYVVEAYFPELSSKLKTLYASNDGEAFENIVEELKRCDLLILDDLGGETQSLLIRDEVLGVVLNYRLVRKKPIIITSNINIARLPEAMTVKVDVKMQNDVVVGKEASLLEQSKAVRIAKRVRELCEEFYFTGVYSNQSIF